MTTERNIIIHAGQAFTLSLDYAGTAGRGQRMHIRASDAADDVIAILTHNGDTNARVIYDGTDSLDITIGASVNGGWLVGANRVEWVYDIEDYDLSDTDDIVIAYRGKAIVYGNRTRPEDVTPSAALASGDGRYVRFDGVQGLSDAQKQQARDNIGAGTPGGSAAWGGITGTLSAQTDLANALGAKLDDLAAGTDNEIVGVSAAGTVLQRLGYTITTLLAAAYARASHTGTQMASTISDFASAALAAVTWSTLTGKPNTFDPSAHKTSHATGGGDALTPADIGAQPVATVLTNTTASFTTAQESKLAGIETSADVTDAGNVGAAIDGATAKTTPVDADTVPLIDSAASNVLKKLSWSNIKATLKTYFDTLYATAAQGTDDRTASGLRSATTVVSVSAATAPTSGQVLTATGASTATWQTPSSSAGTDTFLVRSPLDNEPPASAYATLDTRNSIPVLDFDAAADESAIFSGKAPEGIVLTSGIIARIEWMATSATTGNVRWRVAFERRTSDQDSDSFDTATEATDATNGTSGICETCEITCTNIDSIVAGDSFRVRVTRVGTDGTNDTMSGDAELVSLELRAA